ncbi:PilW family protein [Chamaesiphon sp.]|uniref:PilW family protein n=1 Tax=Chamaesiphon sp. TaxID=2814140 RepID=UPI003593326A
MAILPLFMFLKHSKPSYNSGFTLIELIVSTIILIIVTGLTLDTYINFNKIFVRSNKDIETSHNLSTILDSIGADIKQAGEGITDPLFPVVEFNFDPNNTTATPLQPSTITIRKAIQPALTLCQDIPGDGDPLPSSINIADLTSSNVNCMFGTVPSSFFPPSSLVSPFANLMGIREYRCQLDNYDLNYLETSIDLCDSPLSTGRERIRAAVSDAGGHLRTFDYYDDNFNTDAAQYFIKTAMTVADRTDTPRNTMVPYGVGSPIYLIEERVYALNNSGSLTLSINGSPPATLVKGIAQFNISAKLYNNVTNRAIDPTPATATTLNPLPSVLAGDICTFNPIPAGTIADPQYVCKFNDNQAITDPPNLKWQTIAAIRISLQSKYDSTGENIIPTVADLRKLTATAEYFPRNTLSK